MSAFSTEVTLVGGSPGAEQVDLLFDWPAAIDTDLVFGADYIAPRDDVTVSAALPLPFVAVRFIPPARAELRAELPGLTVRSLVLRPSVPLNLGTGVGACLPGVVFTAEVRYLSNTQRPTVGQSLHCWQLARQGEMGVAQVQQDAVATPSIWKNSWQRARSLPQGIEHPLPAVLVKMPEQRCVGQQQATGLLVVTGFAQQDGAHFELALQGLFENAGSMRDTTKFRHQDGDRTKRAGRVSGWQIARLLTQQQYSDFQSASPFPRGWRGRFQEAVPPPPGISVWLVSKPPGVPTCYTSSANLLFAALAPADSHLLFLCENRVDPPAAAEPVVVPVRKVYFVLNHVSLRRVSDGALVPTLSMSLGLDVSSWTWGFDASLPGVAQGLVEPTADGPVELEVLVNGAVFRVLAENISRERTFGQVSIKVSGRGCNAVLDAPYSAQQVFANEQMRTSQQLMGDVLTLNGIPLGYGIDYGLEPWEVPAGVFNHQGTIITALSALAQAGGGYLIPHRASKSFAVRHLYPVKPWEVATPDVVLPSDVVVRESVAWKEMPAYNRVYVSGQQQGVLGRVTRAGTAGEMLAPMVTDALITTAAAARQRGLAVLGNTGRKLEVGLSLPVLEEVGIIDPGTYVQYLDGSISRIGIVRSTQVSVGFPEVMQTLGVEVHA